MPTISIFFGLIVRMYWRDHPPPHIHVLYQGEEALFAIGSGEIIDGNLPIKATRLIREWIDEHRDDLMENWRLARDNQPLNAIPGADK